MKEVYLTFIFVILSEHSIKAFNTESDTQGSRQSPVNIERECCKPCPGDINELQYSSNYWHTDGIATITNTGANVKVTFKSTRGRPTVHGGPLNGCYELMMVYFHWGPNDNRGTEHAMSYRKFSMEAHFVHYKKMYRGDEEAAQENEDGVAIIAFLLYACREQDNELMKPLVDVIHNLTEPQRTCTMNAEDFLRIFYVRATTTDYFSYFGSLTTPPYSEVVTWIVYPKVVPIAHCQVEAFRGLKCANGAYNKNNCRKLQPLNGRTVYFCSDHSEDVCGEDHD